MQYSANAPGRERPDKLIRYLAARIRRHLLWDSLGIVVPLALASIYAAFVLHRAAWLGDTAFFFAAAAITGVGFLAIIVRMRLRRPDLVSTARLADGKSGAKDHFLTLSTIDPEICAPSLVSRLHRDAANFGDRIEFKRDFPYGVKRSSYAALVGSLLLASLIHLMPPFVDSKMAPIPGPERLRQLAKQMAERPELEGIARELASLAAKLEDPKFSEEEKKALVQEMEKKLGEQQNKQEQQDRREMLAQAADALEGPEQRQASGGEQKKGQQKGAGGLESNLPQDGQGESKGISDGSGESEGDRSAQLSEDMQDGKSAKGNQKEPGQDRNQSTQGDAKNDQPDPNRRDTDPKNDQATKDQGESQGRAGRQQASEEPPQGSPPQDRFYKPGEGKDGIKGAQYVTVQLPEEVAAATKGEGTATKDGKGSGVAAKIPASNVPLPPHTPNVPREKQELPLEYRGLIR
jgi:hypothetical protein